MRPTAGGTAETGPSNCGTTNPLPTIRNHGHNRQHPRPTDTRQLYSPDTEVAGTY